MFFLNHLRLQSLQSFCSGVIACAVVLFSKFITKIFTRFISAKNLSNAFVYFTTLFALSLFSIQTNAVEVGDILDSDASVSYFHLGQAYTKSDNAPFVVESAGDKAPGDTGTTAAIDIWGPGSDANQEKELTLGQSQCSGSSSSSQLSLANGDSLSLPANIPSITGEVFKAGNPLMVRIVDLDENVDSNAIDTVSITLTSDNPNDSETLVLFETSNDSGEFIGIIQTTASSSAEANNCDLSLTPNSKLFANYIDGNDSQDSTQAILRFDPYSRVFNAYTGELVDGLTIRLINNASGNLANVFGDDGQSTFPAEITSGSSVTDSSGKQYNFPTGSYRFPYITEGDYRVEITNALAYNFPTLVSDSVLQDLPSAPYQLAGFSRGESLTPTSHMLAFDLPVDPSGDRIFITKTAAKASAGMSDFVPFDIQVTNIEDPISDTQLVDNLPVGLRFIEGSLRLNDEKYSNFIINNNGRTLSIALPEMAASEVLSISYITQVSSVAKQTLTNRAQISHAIISSNIATASVEIIDDLKREKAQVFGRVILDDCKGNLNAEGLAGIRLMMEDGRYVVTDEQGEWHFEGINPGTHIVQLDVTTLPPYLELATCDESFFHAGQSYSQFIDVQKGSLWRADFHVQPKKPESGDVLQTLYNELIPLNSTEEQQYLSPVQQKVMYTANIGGSGVALNNVIETITLPAGIVLEPNSLKLDGKAINEKVVGLRTYNNSIILSLGDKPKEWNHEIIFNGIITATAKKGSLAAHAKLRYKIGQHLSGQTPETETSIKLFIPPKNGNADPLKNPKFESLSNILTNTDKDNLSDVISALDGLKDLEISVTGHTDSIRIAPRNRHIYADNIALSQARASSVAQYISQQIGLPLDKIVIDGKGKSAPIATNSSNDGRAKNRRVEVRVLKATPDVMVASLDVDVQMAKTETLIPGLDMNQATAAGEPENNIVVAQQPEINDAWFANKSVEKSWVWPKTGYSPDISATNILIQHAKNTRIRLTLNGVPVHGIYFEGMKRAKGKAVAVSEWRGISIEEGSNQFVAEILDRDENVIDYLEQNVQFSGAPAQAEFLPEMSRLVADGIQVPVIAVRFRDKDGYPVRKNSQGELSISSPYQLLQRTEYDLNPLSNTDKLSYHVEGDGIAFIRLQPTTNTGEATLKFTHSNNLTDEIRPWLNPASREWILIGLGDLTLGANNASKNSNRNSNGLVDENLYHDGRLAFYSKGQIPGDFLLTAAYDSTKKEAKPFATLVQPGEYYTLYGDASQQGQDASSGDKLFIKIEKERFYTLYGDLNTGLDKSKLSRYVRNLTGLQVVYQNDLIELTGFASEADSRFVRDEILANGTSGLYRFSNKFINLNSDTLVIEKRDRLNESVVLETKELKRNLDYSIDYNAGTIYFKSPIAATDNNFNPNIIVANYETEDNQAGHIIGGRAGIKLLNNTLQAGISLVDENQELNSNQLNGIDAKLELGKLTLRAEIAQTRPDNKAVVSDGTSSSDKLTAAAKRIDAVYRMEDAEIEAYSQRIDEDFGLQQQSINELGQQSTGIKASLYLTEQDQLKLEGLYQTEISTQLDKQQASAQWTRKLTNSTNFDLGLRSSQQEDLDNTRYVEELSLGLSGTAFSPDLRLNSTVTTDITERSEENDRIKLGAEYRWNESLSVFANYERSFNDNNLERTTMGLRTQPWQGGQVEQSLVHENQDDGYRLFSESGLSHDWKVDKFWLVSFGFNQSKNLASANPEEIGLSEDYYAVSTGWAYRSDNWQWTNRLERRMATSSDTHSARTSLYHPLSEAIAIGGSMDWYKENTRPGYNQTFDSTLDLAIRPRKLPVALLLQTRWVQDAVSTGGLPDQSRRIINNAHLNWKFNRQNQLATQYGFKRILDQYSGDDYAATTQYIAAEWRHQLGETWDIGAHGRELFNVGEQQQNSYGLSVGMRPVKNLWTSLGYNFEGFADNDFSAANYTSHGVYLKLRFKADQDTLSSLRQAFNW